MQAVQNAEYNHALEYSIRRANKLKVPVKKEGEIVLPIVSDVNVKDIWDIIKPK